LALQRYISNNTDVSLKKGDKDWSRVGISKKKVFIPLKPLTFMFTLGGDTAVLVKTNAEIFEITTRYLDIVFQC